MVLKYHLSPYPASTEDWVLKIWEAASDGAGAEIYTQAIPQPHTGTTTITVNGLDKVVHIVRLYGAVSAALLHEYNVEPVTDIVTVFSPIWFKVGDAGANTPAANQDTCVTPELIGFLPADFVINRNNYGMLKEGIHFSFDSPTGTWILTTPDVFNDSEEFTIIRLPQAVSTVVNDSVVGKWFAGFVDISSNTNYSSVHLRKLIRFSGSAQYTFQNTDVIPIGYGFVFQHFGSAGTAKVNFNNGTLLWAGSPKASIDIPQYCEACFVFDGANWNVVYVSQSTFVNAGTGTQPGQTIGVTSVSLGDVPAGDPIYTITHGLNISGDYKIFPSIQSNDASTYFRDNKMGCCWYHHATEKPDKVHVSLQEISPEVQNITLCLLIVKV